LSTSSTYSLAPRNPAEEQAHVDGLHDSDQQHQRLSDIARERDKPGLAPFETISDKQCRERLARVVPRVQDFVVQQAHESHVPLDALLRAAFFDSLPELSNEIEAHIHSHRSTLWDAMHGIPGNLSLKESLFLQAHLRLTDDTYHQLRILLDLEEKIPTVRDLKEERKRAFANINDRFLMKDSAGEIYLRVRK